MKKDPMKNFQIVDLCFMKYFQPFHANCFHCHHFGQMEWCYHIWRPLCQQNQCKRHESKVCDFGENIQHYGIRMKINKSWDCCNLTHWRGMVLIMMKPIHGTRMPCVSTYITRFDQWQSSKMYEIRKWFISQWTTREVSYADFRVIYMTSCFCDTAFIQKYVCWKYMPCYFCFRISFRFIWCRGIRHEKTRIEIRKLCIWNAVLPGG